MVEGKVRWMGQTARLYYIYNEDDVKVGTYDDYQMFCKDLNELNDNEYGDEYLGYIDDENDLYLDDEEIIKTKPVYIAGGFVLDDETKEYYPNVEHKTYRADDGDNTVLVVFSGPKEELIDFIQYEFEPDSSGSNYSYDDFF